MRRAEEDRLWGELKKRRSSDPEWTFEFEGAAIDLSRPCTVVGGRNGAGKSRLLRALADQLDDAGLMLNLHSICEQALSVLHSREDFGEMAEEFGVQGPDEERRSDVQRVVGREYEHIEWYALEIEPSDGDAAERFRWAGEQALVPYFDVKHRGVSYTSREMGLGEFSVHLLFWVLEQYRDTPDLTLLLDEPDAYLPPVGASALLVRLLRICMRRGWRLVVATHSSEIIAQALEEKAFALLRTDDSGGPVVTHCLEDPAVADTLLARPPIRYFCFVEDESACVLARALIESKDRRIARATSIVWGGGSGYMSTLQSHFPKPPRPDISYAYIFDGDKRSEVRKSEANRWPAVFLPTQKDPDELFKSLAADAGGLAMRLAVPEPELARFLDLQEGKDAHDWVNDLGEQYGRQKVLTTLASMWIDLHKADAEFFWHEFHGAVHHLGLAP